MPEHNAVYYYDPKDGLVHPWVQDPSILWPDSAFADEDGWSCVMVNQLYSQPSCNVGLDERDMPAAVLRWRIEVQGGRFPVYGKKIRLE